MSYKSFNKSPQTFPFIVLIFYSLIVVFPGNAAQPANPQSPAVRIIDKPFYQAVENSQQLAIRFQKQLNSFALLPSEMLLTWQKAAGDRSPAYPLLLILQICCVLLAGIFGELFFRRQLRPLYGSICNFSTGSLPDKIFHICLRILIEGVFLFAFILTTFALYVLIFPEKSFTATLAANYLIAGYYIRILLFLATIFLSPKQAGLRLLPLTDKTAGLLYTWSSILFVIEILLARSAINMRVSGVQEGVLLAFNGLIIISSIVIFSIIIAQSRSSMTEYIYPSGQQHARDSLTSRLARHWHLPAFILLFLVTVIWEIRVLDSANSGKIHFGKIIIAVLATPLFFSFDIWGNRLLKMLFTRPTSGIDAQKTLLERIDIEQYMVHIQFIFRLLLLALFCFFVLGLFRIDIAIGRIFTAGMLTVTLTIILLYLAWQFFTGWVDKKIREEMPNDEDADEGGKGGSRRGTLLLMLRKIVLVLLVVLTAISILSALGLNIAPLVAGAGILGLAISFGSQSLITDIFAGIFFLIGVWCRPSLLARSVLW